MQLIPFMNLNKAGTTTHFVTCYFLSSIINNLLYECDNNNSNNLYLYVLTVVLVYHLNFNGTIHLQVSS